MGDFSDDARGNGDSRHARRAPVAAGGLLLAFAFHFALAMDPGDVVFNFSAILLAFFFLFLPDEFAASVATTLSALRRRVAPSAPA